MPSPAGRCSLIRLMRSPAGRSDTGGRRRPGREGVIAEAKRILPDAEIFVQGERRGTAHAVLAARGASRAAPTTSWSSLPTRRSSTPADAVGGMRAPLADGAAVVVLGFRSRRPDRLRPALDGQARRNRRHSRGARRRRGGASTIRSAMAD